MLKSGNTLTLISRGRANESAGLAVKKTIKYD